MNFLLILFEIIYDASISRGVSYYESILHCSVVVDHGLICYVVNIVLIPFLKFQ